MDSKTLEVVKVSKSETARFKRLQLFNPLHKSDVVKLFCGVKRFQLNEEDSNLSRSSKQLEKDLEFDLSEEDEPSLTEITRPLQQLSKEVEATVGKIMCNACAIAFPSSKELRQHNKLDWHRYNVKRKLHEQPSVTEEYFNEMIDDLSSIEGSDSEDDETSKSSAAVSKLIEKISRIQTSESFEKGSSKSTVEESNAKKITNSPKAYFENEQGQIFAIYKALEEVLPLNKSKSGDFNPEIHKWFENPLNTCVIMVSGGHFAAAVFRGNDVILHKTFHSYTVRAKQGGSQGANDSKSGTSHPKSAGASLRRYNEASFSQHVQELMSSWKIRLGTCPLIFYRAVGSSSNVLFSGKSPPFQRDDAKLRTIPFPTKRPTFSEVKRVYSLLTLLHIYDDRPKFLSEHLIGKVDNKIKTSPKKKQIDRAKSKSPKRKELPCQNETSNSEDDFIDQGPTELIDQEIDFTHLKEYDDSLTPEQRLEKRPKKSKPKKPKPAPFQKPEGTIGCILNSLNTNSLEDIAVYLSAIQNEAKVLSTEDFASLTNKPVDEHESTLLHVAAQNNALNVIWSLLEIGFDPAVKNKQGKYPYNCATTKESRTEFRRFMGQFPDKYDYKKGQVPAPLSEELEAEKAEKQKLLNKLKREKEKQKKLERKTKENEMDEQERFLKLSDREKRAFVAEQRILANCKRNSEPKPILVRCFDCACDMTGKVPFEYNKNVFCTTNCLATHRKKFPTPLSVS